ncbi:hypothetical protein FXO38_18952 [Capsicum annuum]|nr:hypothetical protein FXO38_18952 [Capsicum annuum]
MLRFLTVPSYPSSLVAAATSQLGGKLLIFQYTFPSLGVGHLRLRGDDLRVYGTNKEHILRILEAEVDPESGLSGCQVKLSTGVESPSMKGVVAAGEEIELLVGMKNDGGQVYYYPNFQAAVHKDKLCHELARHLTRMIAWESVIRVRCGKGYLAIVLRLLDSQVQDVLSLYLGVRFTTYHGNFMLRSTKLIALPAVDCDKAYTMHFSLEETLLTSQTVYFQVVLLYPFNIIAARKSFFRKKTSLAEDSEDTWKGLPLASGSLDPQGLYLYDDGVQFVLWFGSMLSPDRVKNFLGENFVADYIKTNFKLSVNYDYLSLSMLNLEKILRIQDTLNFWLPLCIHSTQKRKEKVCGISSQPREAVVTVHGLCL